MEQNTDTGTRMMPVVDNKQKNSNGLIIATVIACVVAVCGIGFGIYGVMQVLNRDSQISELKTQIKNSEDKITTLEASQSEIISGDNTTIADSYRIFSDNLANNYTATVFGYYYHYTGSDNVKRTVAARIENSHLTITDIDNEPTVIAEADGMISAYFVEVGNGGAPYFYLIKKDGSVARIDISENGARTIENLDGYEKIVSIFGGGDLFAHLIDINGNVYKNS